MLSSLLSPSISATTDDISAMPHYSRDELCLTKFLGRGAFGEVYEGIAPDIVAEGNTSTRVAVKVGSKISTLKGEGSGGGV